MLISCHVAHKGNLQKTTKEPRKGHFQLPQNWLLGPTAVDKEMLRAPKRLGPDTFPGAELALLPGTSPGPLCSPPPPPPRWCKKAERSRGGSAGRWAVGEWVPPQLLPQPQRMLLRPRALPTRGWRLAPPLGARRVQEPRAGCRRGVLRVPSGELGTHAPELCLLQGDLVGRSLCHRQEEQVPPTQLCKTPRGLI